DFARKPDESGTRPSDGDAKTPRPDPAVRKSDDFVRFSEDAKKSDDEKYGKNTGKIAISHDSSDSSGPNSDIGSQVCETSGEALQCKKWQDSAVSSGAVAHSRDEEAQGVAKAHLFPRGQILLIPLEEAQSEISSARESLQQNKAAPPGWN